MPDEPNNQIEEQLKAWARKRRQEAGAPFEMHPATRKLLQDEVARTFPAPHRREPKPDIAPSWLAVFWPKLVWALPILAVTAIAAALLLPDMSSGKFRGRRALELARQNEQETSGYARQVESRDKAKAQGGAGEVLVAHEQAERTPVPSVQSSESPSPAAAGRAAGESTATSSPVQEPTVTTAKSARESLARGEAEKDSALAYADTARPKSGTSPQQTLADRGLKQHQEQAAPKRYGVAPAEKAEAGGSAGSRARALSAAPAASDPSAPAQISAAKPLAEAQAALNQPARSDKFGEGPSPESKAATRGVDGPTERQPGLTDEKLELALKSSEDRVAVPSDVAVGVQLRPAGAESTDRYAYFSAAAAAQATRQFAQVREYRVNLNSPPVPNVLTSFQLEQNGRQVRIVDADGSTYDGQIEDLPAESGRIAGVSQAKDADQLKKTAAAVRAQPRTGAARRDALGDLNQNLGFRVAGTNRSLNQLVVFEGNLLAHTNGLNILATGIGDSAAVPAQPPPVQLGQPVLFQNAIQAQSARIQGQATIGGSNRIEINAVPATP
jgi:hypothetical protein